MKKYVTPSIETYVYNIADIITISGAAEGEVGGDNPDETYDLGDLMGAGL